MRRIALVVTALAAVAARGEDVPPAVTDPAPAIEPAGDAAPDPFADRITRFKQLLTEHADVVESARPTWDAALTAARDAQGAVERARAKAIDESEITRLEQAADKAALRLDRLCDELDARVQLADERARWDQLIGEHAALAQGDTGARWTEALAAATRTLDAFAAALAGGDDDAQRAPRHAWETAALRLDQVVARTEVVGSVVARREGLARVPDGPVRAQTTERIAEIERALLAAYDQAAERERGSLALRHDAEDLAARADEAQQRVDEAQQRLENERQRLIDLDEVIEQAGGGPAPTDDGDMPDAPEPEQSEAPKPGF